MSRVPSPVLAAAVCLTLSSNAAFADTAPAKGASDEVGEEIIVACMRISTASQVTASAVVLDEAALQKLTGISTPVAGMLEQSMFHVNQVMRFGKLIAVFQPNPADAKSTITTVVIALAVGSSTLEQKKKYENVPVLRNLVPSQVLLGNSSFNTGNSISAGLPVYVRNRIQAIAAILDRG